MNPLLRYLLVALSLCFSLGSNAQSFRLAEQQLQDAVQRADFVRVVGALERGADPNQTNPQGYTALHYAAGCSDQHILLFLLQHGAEYQPNDTIESPLIIAAERGHNLRVKQLIRAGFDPKVVSNDDMDLLTYAVLRDDVTLYKFALEQGLSPFRPGAMGNLPIHLACLEKSDQVLPFLIEAMKDQPSPKNDMGWTPLHAAVSVENRPAIMLLAKSGVNLNALASVGGRPLHIAAARGLEYTIRDLVKLGANPNLPDAQGSFLVHEVCRSNTHKGIGAMLEVNADLNQVNGSGQTPLQVAVENRHPYMARVLINYQADFDTLQLPRSWTNIMTGSHGQIEKMILNEQEANVNVAGLPLLYWAILYGSDLAALRLLEMGADINAVDEYGNTALHHIALKGYRSFLPLLIDHGAFKDPVNDTGQTPLHLAVKNGYEAFVEIYLDLGADINILNKQGESALLIAAAHPISSKMLPIILKANPDLMVTNEKGQNALHLASITGFHAYMVQLTATSIPLDAQDNLGHTALHLAAQNGNKNAVDLLLYQGADPSIINHAGATPAHLAAENFHLETLKALPSDYE